MQVKEYALYKGDELLAMGTKREIAEQLGVSVNSVSHYGTPVYARRTSENGRRLVKQRIASFERCQISQFENVYSGASRMRWIVRVARTMDDVKECYFSDKEQALERMEILKDLSMAVDDATVWMEEISNG